MTDWFTTLNSEQQVGLLTLLLTLMAGLLVKGRAPPTGSTHKDTAPVLADPTCGFISQDHERLERLEDHIRAIRETQIEILTLVRGPR